MRNNKGISLIVLVITIIVIIILAGAVILSLANNNPIAQATEATFKSHIEAYNSELNLALANKYINDTSFNPNNFYAMAWDGTSNTAGTVKEFIPNITIEDGAEYVISQGKLYYIGSDPNKKIWTKAVGSSDGLVLSLDATDFTNTPQTTAWKDKSGFNNDATVYNFDYNSTSGNDGLGAVRFDGVNDYIRVPNVIDNSSDFTVVVKAKIEDLNVTRYFFTRGKDSDGPGNGWSIFVGVSSANEIMGGVLVTKPSSIQKTIYSGYTLPINTDVVISLVFKQKTGLYIYVNGEKKSELLFINDTLRNSTIGMHIGDAPNSLTVFDKYRIKNAMCYNRALTDTEVLNNYNLIK